MASISKFQNSPINLDKFHDNIKNNLVNIWMLTYVMYSLDFHIGIEKSDLEWIFSLLWLKSIKNKNKAYMIKFKLVFEYV